MLKIFQSFVLSDKIKQNLLNATSQMNKNGSQSEQRKKIGL